MTTNYERVTYRTERGLTTVYLRDVVETVIAGAPALSGLQVDKYGDLVEPSAAYLREHKATTGTVLHFVSLDLVTKRAPMEMDLHYAALVPAGTARNPR